MSSRRSLKKNINETIELLYADCFFYQVFVADANKEAADKIIMKIGNIQSDFLSRIGVNEGKNAKGRIHQYYKKLNADFKAQINEIGKEIATLP